MDLCISACFLMVFAWVVCAIEACDSFQPVGHWGDALALYRPRSRGART